MKIQLNINDIKALDISNGTLEELTMLQNKITDKIDELTQQQSKAVNAKKAIYREYNTSTYNKFLDVCMGMSLRWVDGDEWNKEFIPALQEFVSNTLMIPIDTAEICEPTVNSILKLYDLPFTLVSGSTIGFLDNNLAREVKYKLNYKGNTNTIKSNI